MDDRQRVESVFEAALELEPARRRDFVAAACGDNEAMRAAVLRLLAGHDRAGVLDVDAVRMISPERPPERLGAYRLLREIGRGGMGTVYDAERDDGQFRRRVAIKIIRSSDPDLQRRFLAERQILAALDHPNIARLLDGGVAPDGNPYIVMEHVEGLPIDVFCDRMRLTVAERLQLYVLIARAVEFAHRNLVIHCDLKPSNILVTPDGRAKLLDFGVARLLHPWITTDAGGAQLRGLTRAYASPEQLRGESVVTSSDVYSLGVLLYELLTGRRPYEHLESSPADHAAAVHEGIIEPPSARVQRDEHFAGDSPAAARDVPMLQVARARQTSSGRLARELRGDVDAIVGMALRTEPTRRYGSAELLAQDIERHLLRRPVRARDGGRAYAFRMLVRRHRVQAAVIAIAILAVVFGAAGAAWQTRVAQRERARVEAAQLRSEQVTDFLLGLFDTGDAPGPNVLNGRDLASRGMQRIDQLAAQPDVQARMLGALGAIHEGLGEYEQGQQATERALRLLDQVPAQEDATAARLMVQLGVLMRRLGEYDSAQALFVRARDIQHQVLAENDPALGRTLHQLAAIAVYLGDFAEAERRARESLTLLNRRLGETHRVTVNLLTQLGAIQRARGDRARAEQTFRRAIELRRHASGSTRHEILNDRFQLAGLISNDTARSAEAEALFLAELRLLRPESSDDVFFTAWAQGSLADLAWRRGDRDAAEDLRRRNLALRLSAHGPDHPATAEATLLLGRIVLQRGRTDEGARMIQDAVQLYRRSYGERHPAYAAALVELAGAHSQSGDLVGADSVLTIAAAIRLERYGASSHSYLDAQLRRVRVLIPLGQFPLAESILRQILAQQDAAPTVGPATLRAVHAAFADLYTAWRRPQDAARHRQLASSS